MKIQLRTNLVPWCAQPPGVQPNSLNTEMGVAYVEDTNAISLTPLCGGR